MDTPIHAVMVSVDYTDVLNLTVPYNRHHFASVTIVTSLDDYPNLLTLAEKNGCQLCGTDLFYANGADFNKWAALEWALDIWDLRRPGWLCLMDADVLWPKVVKLDRILRPGYLYTPRRRMYPVVPQVVPPEEYWGHYPLHRNENEFAGYSQIFHTSDPILGSPPWHQVDWKHAGGADSFFQSKWYSPVNDRRIRPHWQVLHLGPAGVNWCGRATPRADGTIPAEAQQRAEALGGMLAQRRQAGGQGPGRFAHERLQPTPRSADTQPPQGPT